MTAAQADQIIDFMYGMLRPPDPIATRKAMKVQLLPLNAEIASRAAINGMQVWEYFPPWPLFYGEYRALMRADRLADSDPVCPICGDDKYVTVSLRAPITTDWMRRHGHSAVPEAPIEEMAACPDCNHANTSFWRYDGSEARALDPARVREMLRS